MSNQKFNSLLAESHPSLCIPRVFSNITELRIRKIFNELSLGKISRIDMNEHKNEKGTFNRVYIHFEKWFLNEEAQLARRKLMLGKEIKIIYDNPWFWNVSASKWEPPAKSKYLQAKVSSKKNSSYIEFDNDEFGRDLTLSDLNTTDEFGRDLTLSDLNTTAEFGRDLNTTDEFGRDLTLSDLSVTKDLNNTDEFGRDLTLKRDYYERFQELKRFNRRPDNRRPDNRRPDNRRPDNRRPHNVEIIQQVPVEEEIQERKLIPFVSIIEDIDNLDNLRFEIDYGNPLPIPKINRKPLNKIKVQPKKTLAPINWFDDNDTDDDEEEIDIYADLDINL